MMMIASWRLKVLNLNLLHNILFIYCLILITLSCSQLFPCTCLWSFVIELPWELIERTKTGGGSGANRLDRVCWNTHTQFSKHISMIIFIHILYTTITIQYYYECNWSDQIRIERIYSYLSGLKTRFLYANHCSSQEKRWSCTCTTS